MITFYFRECSGLVVEPWNPERKVGGLIPTSAGECSGLVVNASDSGSSGRDVEPHSGQTVLCP